MVVKIVRPDGVALFECNRVLTGGYSGSSDGESSRTLHIESNEEGGSISVQYMKDHSVYVLSEQTGQTIDRIGF